MQRKTKISESVEKSSILEGFSRANGAIPFNNSHSCSRNLCGSFGSRCGEKVDAQDLAGGDD